MATDSGVLRFLAYARGDRPRTADWRTMQQAFIREEITLDCLHHLTAEDLDDLVPLSCRAAYDAAYHNWLGKDPDLMASLPAGADQIWDECGFDAAEAPAPPPPPAPEPKPEPEPSFARDFLAKKAQEWDASGGRRRPDDLDDQSVASAAAASVASAATSAAATVATRIDADAADASRAPAVADPRDVRDAVLHGEKAPQEDGRWLYTHRGQCYLTDALSQRCLATWEASPAPPPSCRRPTTTRRRNLGALGASAADDAARGAGEPGPERARGPEGEPAREEGGAPRREGGRRLAEAAAAESARPRRRRGAATRSASAARPSRRGATTAPGQGAARDEKAARAVAVEVSGARRAGPRGEKRRSSAARPRAPWPPRRKPRGRRPSAVAARSERGARRARGRAGAGRLGRAPRGGRRRGARPSPSRPSSRRTRRKTRTRRRGARPWNGRGAKPPRSASARRRRAVPAGGGRGRERQRRVGGRIAAAKRAAEETLARDRDGMAREDAASHDREVADDCAREAELAAALAAARDRRAHAAAAGARLLATPLVALVAIAAYYALTWFVARRGRLVAAGAVPAFWPSASGMFVAARGALAWAVGGAGAALAWPTSCKASGAYALAITLLLPVFAYYLRSKEERPYITLRSAYWNANWGWLLTVFFASVWVVLYCCANLTAWRSPVPAARWPRGGPCRSRPRVFTRSPSSCFYPSSNTAFSSALFPRCATWEYCSTGRASTCSLHRVSLWSGLFSMALRTLWRLLWLRLKTPSLSPAASGSYSYSGNCTLRIFRNRRCTS